MQYFHMKFSTIISLLTSTLLLVGCFASAPTYKDIKTARVEKLSDGVLPQCEVAFGSDTSEWNQCISETPTRFVTDSKSTYKGTWIAGEPNGTGEFFYADGTSYKGGVKKAFRHGRGKAIYRNGDIYEGEFDVGWRQGWGRYSEKGGARYEGQIKRGKPNGTGIQTTRQGTSVEGKFTDFGRGNGEVKVTFKDGNIWTGRHDDLWTSRRKTTGKLRTPNGEIVNAELEAINTASCSNSANFKPCNTEFKLTITGLTGCSKFNVNEPSYSPTGLPRQAGPIFLGMSVKNFECVLTTKFKDVTGDGLARGISSAFGSPIIANEKVGNLDVKYASAGFYTTTVEVANLFSIPSWMRRPSNRSGKSFGGEISAIFLDDRLVVLKIGQPSVPASYLTKKYGRAKYSSKNIRERCIMGNKVISEKQHFFSNRLWSDTNVLMIYEMGTGLEGGNINSFGSFWFFGNQTPPRCSARIQPRNVYTLIDTKGFDTIKKASDNDRRLKQKEEEKIYKGF